ncbi:Fe(3+) ABC transporter substrate-binding protein [uncultured Hyphomicrobium sp.]|uniref:Fe(3+) ABC transporter substrate-binding protein n=1 Tax=uncultured Hyphomicrobium sp. TaxID=194373 RepID=UPI0025FEC3EA|nr:Fe(3+) ABC transporter substrate-binding protein [uncultured Hyphomicrobium sp.]
MSIFHLTLRRASRALALPLLALAPIAATGAQAAEQVNVYSFREPGLIDPLFKTFTQETGIKVNVVYSKDGLVERMTAEGRNSPADLLITPESGLLIQAKAAGVTQALQSKVLDDAIDVTLRDPEGHWFGLTRRARVVYASKDRVKQDAITYEELADPKWKGKICIRSGQHTYNIALVASMIAHDGEEKAEKWLIGLRDNLARKPAGGDREGVRDVQAGLCDLAIGNTYYMAAMLKNPEQKPWADAVKILFPNAADRGTHVNISGAALAAHAPHRDNAVKLLEFMVSSEAQQIYAEGNGEYPVTATAHASDLVKSWGELKPDSIPLSQIASLRKKASELVDKVRFDAGPNS